MLFATGAAVVATFAVVVVVVAAAAVNIYIDVAVVDHATITAAAIVIATGRAPPSVK